MPRKNDLTCRGFLLKDDKVIPFEELTEQEKEDWRKEASKRMERSFALSYKRDPEQISKAIKIMEAQGLVKGGGHFSRQADDRQAVGAVGGDLKLHHMVIQANDRLQVISGLAVLAENKDTVWDAVGELCLLGVEVGQSADGVHLSVIGH